jgi:cysteinyl-tRNA synthetase
LLPFLLLSCGSNGPDYGDRDFKEDMRKFVQGISSYARSIDPDFIVIPQNGQEILTSDGQEGGTPAAAYISAIDGVGREDLFYGYNNDNELTPAAERNYLLAFADIAENNGVEVLTTDYCWDHAKMDSSYAWNAARGYISLAADERDLNNIPDYPAAPYNENSDTITTLAQARNFLYLLDPSQFADKQAFIGAVKATNYDAIIMDLFDASDVPLTGADVVELAKKQNGGVRLVICYMSIGEAEDYRYYWKSGWEVGDPSWIEDENPDWEGNYKVRYWKSEWQDIIYGNDSSYLKKILDAGFDGVYLDIIDAFEYFE